MRSFLCITVYFVIQCYLHYIINIRICQEAIQIPQKSLILDAACRTGSYIPTLLEHGHTVMGIDQSEGEVPHSSI